MKNIRDIVVKKIRDCEKLLMAVPFWGWVAVALTLLIAGIMVGAY